MRKITPSPVDWVTVEEQDFTATEHAGVHCVLVPAAHAPSALDTDTWIGRDVGEVGIWGDGTYEEGLTRVDRDVPVEFFVHAWRASGAALPIVEIRQPFLWYWDAYPSRDGWRYVNRAGREQEVVRVEVTSDAYRVEIRALELRQWLAACGRTVVVQLDVVPKADLPSFDRVDEDFRNEWAHFSLHAVHDPGLGGPPAFSRLLGQYLISGQRNARVPRWEGRKEERDYTSFIYGLDETTGQPLLHSCDPDKLGTYFDKDQSRLHYLTPVYFKRELLQPYQAEPHRYQITHVRDVHDLHASTVATDLPVLTAHVVVDDSCFNDGHVPQLLDELQQCLTGHFDVGHSTFQFEPASHAAHEHATHA